MNLRAIVQINPDSKERIVTLTADRGASVEDFLVRSRGWENSTFIEEEILVFGSDEFVNTITNIELRSDVRLIMRGHSSSVL